MKNTFTKTEDVLVFPHWPSCVVESVKANGFLNAKTYIKKFHFGGDKCKKLHIGKKKHLCPDLYVDSWILDKKDENKKGIQNLADVFDGDYAMENVDSVKYLGDILPIDGSNSNNIEARKSKATGAAKQIIRKDTEIQFLSFSNSISLSAKKIYYATKQG